MNLRILKLSTFYSIFSTTTFTTFITFTTCTMILNFLSAPYSHATLGETVDSIEVDGRTLSAHRLSAVQRTANGKPNITVHTLELGPSTVREYVSSSNKVFGIAWNGNIHPDLTRLLGSYVNGYQAKLQENSKVFGRRQLTLKTDHLVVEKWGHMRALEGRAYDPSLIPTGVTVNDIK